MPTSKRLAFALLASSLALLASPAGATIAIENVTFHRSTNIGYDGSSPVDEGGGLFIQVRNTGATAEALTSESLLINGTPITTIMTQGPGSPTPGWVRVWPEVIAPGEVATWTVKTFGGTVTEGATLASVQVSSDGGSTATATSVALVTPTLRVAHVVPSQDLRETWVFLRNDDSTAITIDQLVLNDDVTSSTTFVGGATVAPGMAVIAKVAHGGPQALLTPLAIRASGTRAADAARVTVGAFVRLTEPEYGVTTWGSSPSNDEARVQALRRLFGLTGNSWGGVSPILDAKANRYFYRQRMLDILDMTDTDTVDLALASLVQSLDAGGAVGAWFVEDEPDLNYGGATRNPRAMLNLSRAYWRLSPNVPTHLNLVSSRSAQAYALAVDHPAIDCYMQYAPRHYGSVISQTYNIDEALDQTENLKKVAEPVRVWMTPQGVSPGTWGTQPTEWGIAIQFWAQVMGGAKGLDGFKFDDTLTSSADPGGVRTQRLIDLIRELRLVEGLLLYGDPVRTVTTNKTAANLAARMVVGEEAILVPVVNLQASHTRTIGTWGTPSKTDQTDVDLVIPVPAWINVERVVEVLPSGFAPIAHTIDSGNVLINDLTVVDRRVFLVGANDATPPGAPTGVQIVPDLENPGGTLLSWKQPFDNVGVMGYKVLESGVEVADVRTPIASINPPAGADCPPVYTVRAYDGSGNESADSSPVSPPQGDGLSWRFETPGDNEGWAALNDIQSSSVVDGQYVLTIWDAPGGAVNTVDAYIANGGVAADAATFDTLRVRLKNETPNTSLQAFWESDLGGWAGPGSSGGQRVFSATITANDAMFRDYILHMASNPAWETTIRNLRLDPANGPAGGVVRIDRIELLSSATHSPAWTFKRDGDAEGWDDPATRNQIISVNVAGGEMEVRVGLMGDPFLTSPPFRASAAHNRYVIIRLKNETSATASELFYSSTAAPGFSGDRRVGFAISANDAAMKEYVLDMQGMPGWSGSIDRLRFDVTSGGPTGYVRVESIRLASTLEANEAPQLLAPAASLAADAGETIALPAMVACDPDGEDSAVQVTISVTSGAVTLGDLAGARVVAGEDGSASVTVRGQAKAINAILARPVLYTAAASFNGTAVVTFALDDMGNGQPGGPLVAGASYDVAVTGPSAGLTGWVQVGN